MSSTYAHEEHFSVADIGSRWNLSSDAVRRLFAEEPGVVRIGAERRSRYKRTYVTLRVPASVVERVHRRLSNL